MDRQSWYPGAPYDPKRAWTPNPRPLILATWGLMGYVAAAWIFGWAIRPPLMLFGMSLALTAGEYSGHRRASQALAMAGDARASG
jgi:hypothetical protein